MYHELKKSLVLIKELQETLVGNQSHLYLSSYLGAIETELKRQLDVYTNYTEAQHTIADNDPDLYKRSVFAEHRPWDTELADVDNSIKHKSVEQIVTEMTGAGQQQMPANLSDPLPFPDCPECEK